MNKNLFTLLALHGTLLSLAACAGNFGGSCQQAVISGEFTSGKPSELLAGYLDLNLEDRSMSRCTVQVTPQRTADQTMWNLDLAFSRHCYSHNPASIQATTLHLFNGRRFEGNLPITLELVDKKVRARAALEEIGIPDEGIREALAQFFSDESEILSMSTFDNCRPNADSRNPAHQPERFAVDGKQVLCFNYGDFAQMRATLRLRDIATEAQRRAVNQLLGQFEQPEDIDAAALSAPDRAAFHFSQMQKQIARAMDERPHTAFVDFAVIGCRQDVRDEDIYAVGTSDDPIASNAGINRILIAKRKTDIDRLRSLEPMLCPQKEAVVAALRTVLTIKGNDPINLLAEIGFSEPLDPSPGLLYTKHFKPVEARYAVLGELSRHFQDNLSQTASLAFHAQDEDNRQSFSTALIPGTTAERYSTERVLLQIPERPDTPRFQKTDSGAVLLLGGVFPVAALTTVNGELSSGGASVVPLDFEKHEVAAHQTRYPERPTPLPPQSEAEQDKAELITRSGSEPVPKPVGEVTSAQSYEQTPVHLPSERPGPFDGTAPDEADVPVNATGTGTASSVESAQIDGKRRSVRLPEEGTCY